MAKTSQSRRQRGPQTRQERTRAKVAAQRADQRKREARRRLAFSVGIVVVVVGVIGALVAVGLSKKPATSATRQPAPGALVAQVENVPAGTLNAVGAGAVISPPAKIPNAPPLTSGGKPEVVYVGAEFCPHCGAERWAMVNALSRFGTFAGLDTTRSAAADGNVPTFSFYQASYTSPYLALSTTEQYTNQPGAGYYVPLQPLTALDKTLIAKYESPPYVPAGSQGSIPFVDFGNRYVEDGVQFDDSLLINAGLSWDQVATDMANPASPIGQRIDGSANVITATICKMTSGRPSSVCTAPGVVTATTKLQS